MKEKNKRVDSVAGGVESPDNWLDADFVNQSQEELENVVRASGVAFDGNNEQQVAQAITDHALGASYAEDTGTTNNYILSITGSRQVPPALVKGYCLFFQTGNVNTSTTPTLNYAGLGVKTIIDENGTNAILPGDIKVGVYNQVVYDGTNWRLVLPRVPNASETVAGIIKTATAALVNAGTDDTTALTPLQFKTKMAAVRTQYFGSASSWCLKYYDYDGNVIFMIQGGKTANADFVSGSYKTVTLHTAFLIECSNAIGNLDSAVGGSNPNGFVGCSSRSTTSITFVIYEYTGTTQRAGISWIAFGR